MRLPPASACCCDPPGLCNTFWKSGSAMPRHCSLLGWTGQPRSSLTPRGLCGLVLQKRSGALPVIEFDRAFWVDMLARLAFPTQGRRACVHWLVSSSMFSSAFNSFQHPGRLPPWLTTLLECFILLGASVDGVVFLICFSESLCLVFRSELTLEC